MDTKLKKGKLIRSFIYRLVAAGALLTTLAAGFLGREALINLHKEGAGTLTGEIYYLTEFREYIASLYTYGMLGYAGIGDDNGYPLTDASAYALSKDARQSFYQETQKGGNELLYLVQPKNDPSLSRSNISYPVFSEYDGHLLLPEDVILCCYWNGETGLLYFFANEYDREHLYPMESYYNQQYKPNTEEASHIKLLLAVRNTDNHTGTLAVMANRAVYYRNLLLVFFASGTVTILSWILCIFSMKTGRQARREFLQLTSKISLEIRLLLVLALLYIDYTFGLFHFTGNFASRANASTYLWLYIPTGMAIYLLHQDFAGHGYAIWRQTFLYGLYCHFKEYYSSIHWQRRALRIYHGTLAAALLLFVTDFFAFIIFLGLRRHYYIDSSLKEFIYISGTALIIILLVLSIILMIISYRLKKFIRDTCALTNKISDMSAGNTGVPLLLHKKSLLAKAAADLNAIENGVETAIEQNNRSNKMRVELITNVSHDLKTPLTSIINYADLLCEENLPEPAGEYAASLQSKAYRLKSMVQDVFDLSKATSGNLSVEKNRLDLAKLIRQTLADMDERIQESSLVFKLNIAAEPLMIEADGEKLYRIFQNLIINALQYSLENSRVHILLEQKNNYAYARIKNTSLQELNFAPEEIVERFVRADVSRTTEGSGLGLSIVQSFTEACGGIFSIELDADLFTACVSFPLAPAQEENPQAIEASANTETMAADKQA